MLERNPRNRGIDVRMTPEERLLVDQAARIQGLPTSRFIRERILEVATRIAKEQALHDRWAPYRHSNAPTEYKEGK